VSSDTVDVSSDNLETRDFNPNAPHGVAISTESRHIGPTSPHDGFGV
jgi:hypothetical protein